MISRGIISLWGVGPVGPIHFGYDNAVLAQRSLIAEHVHHTILLADLHIMMSHGLSYYEARRRSAYYEAVFSAGYDVNARFVRGSDFQSSPDYVTMMLSAARMVTISQLLDSLPSRASRKRSNQTLASMLYSLMQCLDAVYLEADLVLADEGQRKTYDLLSVHPDLKDGIATLIELRASMTARAVPTHYRYYPLMVDIAGRPLNERTSQTRISVHETSDSLRQKVRAMYAPVPGQVEIEGRKNALLQYVQYSALPWIKVPATIQTRDGEVVCQSFDQVREHYETGRIHPGDLKEFLFEVLLDRVQQVRKRLATFSCDWIDISLLKGRTTTKDPVR